MLQSIKRQEEQEEEDESDINYEHMILPQVSFSQCPIKTSLGVLGKKWTMLIIRDIGIHKIERFNRLLDHIPGLTPRVLSLRLKELEREGLIECTEEKRFPMMVLWRLTEKGKDTLPILMLLAAFGSKWYSHVVFEDKMPRKINELFPLLKAGEIIRGYI